MISWNELQTLFARSHTWMLVEDFCSTFVDPMDKKLDFMLVAKVQEVFEHLFEVFEQDIRLGEVTPAVTYCLEHDIRSVLKSAVYKIIPQDDVLAVKAIMVSAAEKERALLWN